MAELEEGPNVKIPPAGGCEVKEGPIDVNAPGRPPASELHRGYTYIYTGRLRIRLAPYLGSQAGPDANVN